jgi:hypothetical protein
MGYERRLRHPCADAARREDPARRAREKQPRIFIRGVPQHAPSAAIFFRRPGMVLGSPSRPRGRPALRDEVWPAEEGLGDARPYLPFSASTSACPPTESALGCASGVCEVRMIEIPGRIAEAQAFDGQADTLYLPHRADDCRQDVGLKLARTACPYQETRQRDIRICTFLWSRGTRFDRVHIGETVWHPP